jgi:hypothetical protein
MNRFVLAVAVVTLVTLLVPGTANAQCIACTTLFEDGFESYPVQTFPTSGGWTLRYAGAGSSYQYVTNAQASLGAQALRRSGTSRSATTLPVRGTT